MDNQHQQPNDNKSSNTAKPYIDFNFFLNTEMNDIDSSNKCQCKTINECNSIQRVIKGLIYYQTLNNTKKENSNGQAIFSEFLIEIYKHYLDDISHIVVRHDNDLESINNLLLQTSESLSIGCDADHCLLSDRHYAINDGQNGNINANIKNMHPLSIFHQQTWDNVHFYLTHLFDLGMR
eukprot:UN09209